MDEKLYFNFLLKEEAINAEKRKDYLRTCSVIGLSLREAIEISSLENIKLTINDTEKEKELDAIFHDDIGIKKLYVAAFVDSLVKSAMGKGLQTDICEAVKREYYHKIHKCDTEGNLRQCSLKAAERLIKHLEHIKSNCYSRRVNRAIDYIHSNRFQKILPRDIADYLQLNRSYFSDQFAKEVGITPTEFIQKVKIDTAKYYLENKLHKPEDISDLLSYSSYSYFCKVFRKHAGCTPKAYAVRKLGRNG